MGEMVLKVAKELKDIKVQKEDKEIEGGKESKVQHIFH